MLTGIIISLVFASRYKCIEGKVVLLDLLDFVGTSGAEGCAKGYTEILSKSFVLGMEF